MAKCAKAPILIKLVVKKYVSVNPWIPLQLHFKYLRLTLHCIQVILYLVLFIRNYDVI